jgi:uncharacterized protein (TIGR03437 family)
MTALQRVAGFVALLAAASVAPAQVANIAVTSGASFEPGVPPRGSIASIFCTGLDLSQIAVADRYPLPFTLAGVEVRIGGAPAPLFAVAPLGGYQQVNLQVPQEAQFGGPDIEVEVSQQGRRGTVRAPVGLSSPGDFFRWPGGWAALQHAADYAAVTPQNPARAGEAILAYLTGLPGTQPVVPTGQPSPFEPLAIVPQFSMVASAETYQVVIGSTAVTPLFVGLAPGLAGVYQINFAMPAFAASGSLALTLRRVSCVAFFGSCAAGGGVRTLYVSSPAMIPVR